MENKTPEDVKPDFDKLADGYLRIVGTHERPDITKHDYIKGCEATWNRYVEPLRSELTKLREEKKWISSKEQLPEYNVSVLVFIPEEDNHVTTGMYDISNKWVLLDEYRVPKSQVTYWRPHDIDLPEDKSYEKCSDTTEEQDTITYQMRELNMQVHSLTAQLSKAKELLKQIHPMGSNADMYQEVKQFLNDNI